MEPLRCGIATLNDALVEGSLDPNSQIRNIDGQMICVIAFVVGNADSNDCLIRLDNMVTVRNFFYLIVKVWSDQGNQVTPVHLKHFLWEQVFPDLTPIYDLWLYRNNPL